jgi:hypothetical protein
MDPKEYRKLKIKDHVESNGDRSSIFYVDEDFKDLMSEWDKDDKLEEISASIGERNRN